MLEPLRFRSRSFGSLVSSPIECGQVYTDTTYPYGDGPWGTYINPYVFTFDENASGVGSTEYCFDQLHPGPPYRKGGPFVNVKVSSTWPHLGPVVDCVYWRNRYLGGFVGSRKPQDYLPYKTAELACDADFGDVSSYGATGWSRFSPGRPEADMGVFVGEIKDVPRMLRTTAKSFSDIWKSFGGSSGSVSKRAANHWLNTQFGWLPFLNDLRKFYKLSKNLDERLKQLKRDNGQWVKRGGTITSSEETTELLNTDVHSLWPNISGTYFSTYPYGPYGKTIITKTDSQKVWFEARMKYWIPYLTVPGYWTDVRATAHLFGLSPNPSLIWELTPWSWMIDWVSNCGDVINNISMITSNDLTAKYAYVMGTTESLVKIHTEAYLRSGTYTLTDEARLTAKLRHEASPFGFGLTGDDFTARQWSILSALGITRIR